jgi:hypothetical protein
LSYTKLPNSRLHLTCPCLREHVFWQPKLPFSLLKVVSPCRGYIYVISFRRYHRVSILMRSRLLVLSKRMVQFVASEVTLREVLVEAQAGGNHHL